MSNAVANGNLMLAKTHQIVAKWMSEWERIDMKWTSFFRMPEKKWIEMKGIWTHLILNVYHKFGHTAQCSRVQNAVHHVNTKNKLFYAQTTHNSLSFFLALASLHDSSTSTLVLCVDVSEWLFYMRFNLPSSVDDDEWCESGLILAFLHVWCIYVTIFPFSQGLIRCFFLYYSPKCKNLNFLFDQTNDEMENARKTQQKSSESDFVYRFNSHRNSSLQCILISALITFSNTNQHLLQRLIRILSFFVLFNFVQLRRQFDVT